MAKGLEAECVRSYCSCRNSSSCACVASRKVMLRGRAHASKRSSTRLTSLRRASPTALFRKCRRKSGSEPAAKVAGCGVAETATTGSRSACEADTAGEPATALDRTDAESGVRPAADSLGAKPDEDVGDEATGNDDDDDVGAVGRRRSNRRDDVDASSNSNRRWTTGVIGASDVVASRRCTTASPRAAAADALK